MVKSIFISILFVMLFGTLLLGCKNNPLDNPNSNPVVDSFVENNKQIEEEVNESQKTIGEETENIDEKTTNIDENIKIIQENSNSLESNFNELQNIVPELMLLSSNDPEIMELIYRSIDAIRASATNIEQSNESITQSNETIMSERQELLKILKDIQNNNKRAERIQSEINKKDAVIAERDKKIDELEDAAEQASTKYLGMLIAVGVVIMVLGVLGFFYNFRVGLAGLAIGGITVAVTAATMYYMGWFAIIGLVTMGLGLLLLIGYLAWILFRGRTWYNATEENAELMETIKQELPETKRYEIFGDRIKPGIAQQMQSKRTQKEIDRIRRNIIKPKIENTIAQGGNGDFVIQDGIIYQKVKSTTKIEND